MKLSVIIPVYNEGKTIASVVQRLSYLRLPNIRMQIIVVDDGSTDDTKEEIEDINNSVKNIQAIHCPVNKGKGAAIKIGIFHATGDFIIIQDADTEYNPEDIFKLLRPILQGKAQVVFGTRLKRFPNFFRDERTPRFVIHYFGNKFLSLVTSVLYGQWITDMETGYKIFPTEVAKKLNLKSSGFDFEPEITAKLLKLGYKIKEIPIRTNPRGYDEGKKLRTIRDGFKALYSLFKFRFVD